MKNKYKLLIMFILFSVNVLSQENYSSILLKSDNIVENEIKANKKFHSIEVISISDDKGNILILSEENGVKFPNKKGLKKKNIKINKKNKNLISNLLTSQILSLKEFENKDCDIMIRDCKYLRVNLFDEKNKLKVSSNFFIPLGKFDTNSDIENIKTLYFSEIK